MTIQYVLLKVFSDPWIRSVLPECVGINSTDSSHIYPQNQPNDFRVSLVTHLDTSTETGYPFISINSILIPHKINLLPIVKECEIVLKINWDEDDLSQATRTLVESNITKLRAKGSGEIASINYTGDQLTEVTLKPFISHTEDITTTSDLVQVIRNCLWKLSRKLTVIIQPRNNANPKAGGKVKITNDGLSKLFIKFDEKLNSALNFAPNEVVLTPGNSGYSSCQPSIRPLMPSSAYIHAEFIKTSDYLDSEYSNVLAIVPLHAPYDNIYAGEPMEDFAIFSSFTDNNPINARISQDTLKTMHFKIKTVDGLPFPFCKSSKVFSSFIISFNS